jgi:hypothetical protein
VGDQLHKVIPGDVVAGDEFGFSVATSDGLTVVGARFSDANGVDSGSAYLIDTDTGMELFKLLPTDGDAAALFGYSVAISGNSVIVGAIGDDGMASVLEPLISSMPEPVRRSRSCFLGTERLRIGLEDRLRSMDAQLSSGK